MRDFLAVLAGKTALRASRGLGRGGTSLPGRVALSVQPSILGRLARALRQGTVIITGTNGKTTTASLLAHALEDGGRTLVHNRSGANLEAGLVTAFLDASSRHRTRPDLALLEVDEATMPEAVRRLRPLGVVVTNFFRDQLDRYGELDTTVALVAEGLKRLDEEAFVLLNADDPLTTYLGRGRPGRVVYYGISDETCGRAVSDETREQRYCPDCGAELAYHRFYYGHLGHYACPAGDFARPRPNMAGRAVRLRGIEGSETHVVADGGVQVRMRLSLPGFYNVYNGLAALAAAMELGLIPERAAESVGRARASFGRMERVVVDGRNLLLTLVKNPTGFNQVLRTFFGSPEGDPSRLNATGDQPHSSRRVLIAVNDLHADGRDISWLWDVDFEILARPESGIAGVITSGLRAHDAAVRLKYAGVPEERVKCLPRLPAALDAALAATTEGETLFVTPTYTAMLELRDHLSRRGHVPRFWEGDLT